MAFQLVYTRGPLRTDSSEFAARRDPVKEAQVKAMIGRYLFFAAAGVQAVSANDPALGLVAMQVYMDVMGPLWQKYMELYWLSKGM